MTHGNPTHAAILLILLVTCMPGLLPAEGPAEFLQRGVSAFKKGNLPNAREHLENTTRLSPRDVRAWYWLGRTLYSLKQFGGAAEAFEKVIAIRPAYEQAYTWAGLSLYAAGQHEKAIPHLERSARTDRKNGTILTALGAARFISSRKSSAAEPLKAALEQSLSKSNSFTCHYLLGLIDAERRAYVSAWRHFQSALENASTGAERKKALAALEQFSGGRTAPVRPARKGLTSGISLGWTYDTNVSFAPEDTGISTTADLCSFVQGWMRWQRNAAGDFLAIDLLSQVYASRYKEMSDYDLFAATARLSARTRTRIPAILSLNAGYYEIDGNRFLTVTGAEAGTTIALKNRLALSPSVGFEKKDYLERAHSQLDSQDSRLEISVEKKRGPVQGFAEGRYLKRDADSDVNSFEGTRGKAGVRWALLGPCELECSLAYETRRYENDYPGTTKQREDGRATGSVGLRLKLSETCVLSLKWSRTDSDSNIEVLDYKRDTVTVTTNFVF
ncbi:tetratricopeptide repeat protein [Planctomycetota bacterium]